MMARPLFLAGFLVIAASLTAEDLGRTDRFWHVYLSETVRRGMPLLSSDPHPGVVPFWPWLEQARGEALSLEPGADVDLLAAWVDGAEGAPALAKQRLLASWPRPALVRFRSVQWGEALFALWQPGDDVQNWTNAWLAWSDKAYSPKALLRGLEVLEQTDPPAVAPLLTQARELYPEDRRFFSLLLKHPGDSPLAASLVARDLVAGGWAAPTIRRLLNQRPDLKPALVQAGYPEGRLAEALVRDYGVWLNTDRSSSLAGAWTWDADLDGIAESTLVFDQGLVSWTRQASEGLWCLSFRQGRPDTLRETRGGATWVLHWESYPAAASLDYNWGQRTIRYRFAPLAQSLALWPQERWASPSELWPVSLAELWLPLDARLLAQAASSIETWEGSVRVSVVSLAQGQVWLQVEDGNRDGIDDRWSYFRSGRLASVWQDVEGRGQASLREIYRKGELSQVQARSPSASTPEWVLFPEEEAQLWDFHGHRRPLDRVFTWSGGQLSAFVFSRTELPWETMPIWESRP